MLTVDHIKLRRKKGVVEVVPLCGLDLARARELAGFALDVAKAHEGEARAALEDALDELPVEQDELRFGRGLKKLILDACDFDVDTEVDPEALRADVFRAAARARAVGPFDRASVIDGIAKERSLAVDDVERALYADLSAAHAVKALDLASADDVVERYRVVELQAVLLRATQVIIQVDASTLELRALLRALKLHQLLFDVDPSDEEGSDGVRLTVEGPMALFTQSTRYGLKLALLLPHVLACKRFDVEATVRLRKGGGSETFRLEGKRAVDVVAPAIPDLTAALMKDINDLAGPWQATVAVDVLKVPGAGSFVPDLALAHADSGEVIYVEILGFWSRSAVWKRVELVEKGLPFRVLFCAGERLRVSEQALPDDAPSALVIFKGALRAQKVLAAAERIRRQS